MRSICTGGNIKKITIINHKNLRYSVYVYFKFTRLSDIPWHALLLYIFLVFKYHVNIYIWGIWLQCFKSSFVHWFCTYLIEILHYDRIHSIIYTLYTTLPHDKLNTRLKETIHKAYFHRNDGSNFATISHIFQTKFRKVKHATPRKSDQYAGVLHR